MAGARHRPAIDGWAHGQSLASGPWNSGGHTVPRASTLGEEWPGSGWTAPAVLSDWTVTDTGDRGGQGG
eukprot:11030308-Alexandrium_andersonii.AAC.1